MPINPVKKQEFMTKGGPTIKKNGMDPLKSGSVNMPAGHKGSGTTKQTGGHKGSGSTKQTGGHF